MTTRVFVEKARAVHGERYDYSRAAERDKGKLLIICPVHGEFWQSSANHLATGGCNKCGINKRAVSSVKSTESLIEDIKAVHGCKYDYSLIKNDDINGKLQLICPTHGPFAMWVNELRKGRGCRKCAWQKHRYLPRFEKAHGSKYDYSQVPDTFGSLDKLPILCQLHGVFHQTPTLHARGHGCAQCAALLKGWTKTDWVETQNGRKATLYIILLENAEERFFKIGITYRGISGRFNKQNMPYMLKTVALFNSYNAGKVYDLEKQLHRELAAYSYRPTVSFGGQTECFSSVAPILPLLPPETFFLKNRPVT